MKNHPRHAANQSGKLQNKSLKVKIADRDSSTKPDGAKSVLVKGAVNGTKRAPFKLSKDDLKQIANNSSLRYDLAGNVIRGGDIIEVDLQAKSIAGYIDARLRGLDPADSVHNSLANTIIRYLSELNPGFALKINSAGTTSTIPLLPSNAPEKFQGLRGPETPPDFIRRVYGDWLGKGLTRAHIRQLDPTLSTAIDNWLRKPGCAWPTDVDLPTLKVQNDRDVAAISAGGQNAILGKFTGNEAARLGAALARRSK